MTAPLLPAVVVIGVIMAGVGAVGLFGIVALPGSVTTPVCSPSVAVCYSFALSWSGYSMTGWLNGSIDPGWTINTYSPGCGSQAISSSGFCNTNVISVQSPNGTFANPTGSLLATLTASSVMQSGGSFSVLIYGNVSSQVTFWGFQNRTFAVSASLGYSCSNPNGGGSANASYCVGTGTSTGITGIAGEERQSGSATFYLKLPGHGHAGGPSSGNGGSAATLSANFATNASGLIVTAKDASVFTGATATYSLSYSWLFGDGSPSASGLIVQHSYAKPGTYTVLETVAAFSSGPNPTIRSNVSASVSVVFVGNISTCCVMTNHAVSGASPFPVLSPLVLLLLLGPIAMVLSFFLPAAKNGVIPLVGLIVGSAAGYLLGLLFLPVTKGGTGLL